jgi:hypothetical protein
VLVAGSALSLTSCDDPAGWFAKPFNPTTPLSYLSLAPVRVDRPVTAADLIDADGTCSADVTSSTQPGPGDGTATPGQASRGSVYDDSITVGMSECEVVARLGQATDVSYGTAPSGSRSVVLTYKSGSRPGIYRFERGRLSEMNRVAGLPAVPRKSAKKKPPKFGIATSGQRS